MAAIDLVQVGVDYPLYDSRARSLKQAITDLGGRLSRRGDRGRIVVEALRNVTLSLRPGDRVGLIGRNGAGKSTLLKVLAGVYEPSLGRADITGHVASIFSVTMGMDFEATGYENIVIRGVLLGMTFAEARSKIPEIEEFTELGEFLSLPMRSYSSGMVLRLAFAIATGAESDILLVDEVIGAGDTGFARKARERLETTIERAKIMVIATHDEGVVASMCTRAIVLSAGRVAFDGSTQDAIAFYKSSLG
jgi:ABC-2 type transport system ATP-binding protein